MANEFSRNTQDASLTETATIPATAVDAFTADINLGTNSKAFLTEEHELEIVSLLSQWGSLPTLKPSRRLCLTAPPLLLPALLSVSHGL
jgi:hypothetical protein